MNGLKMIQIWNHIEVDWYIELVFNTTYLQRLRV